MDGNEDLGSGPSEGAVDPSGVSGLKICVNTQTPLIWFTHEIGPLDDGTKVTDLSQLKEGDDYNYSSGGVTRMVLPLLKRMLSDGTVSEAHWVSLNPSAPETIKADGITHHFVSLEKGRLANYGKVKEIMWKAAHGTTTDAITAEEIFMSDDFPDFSYYDRLTAEAINRLDKETDFDLFYLHDFQQLQIGHMLNTLKPKMYRWHIPFDYSTFPEKWRETFITYFNSYDMMIVSSSKYLESLKEFGYSGIIKKLYPYVDPSDYSVPKPEETSALCERLGITNGDEVILVVARMDPMKGQDHAISAFASIFGKYPSLKLVLVGNGSFSSSKRGVGLSKGEKWRADLETQVQKLGLEGRVIFAGHLSQQELDSMYERCLFTMLPSVKEGFGLVVVESWLHRKACLITDRAGITEIIKDGENGMLFNPDDAAGMAEKLARMVEDRGLRKLMAEKGSESARLCTIDEGLKAETKIIKELVGG